MSDDAAAQVGLSLIEQLGSCNKRSRDKALRLLLKSWLPSQPNLTHDFMKMLCRCLFNCVWDADFLSRGVLIDRLSSLLPRLDNSSLSLRYFSSFLLTIRREWTAIDGLRLDKFYLFIRRFLHYSFAFLKIHSWDLDLTSRLISRLKDTCFLVKQGNSFGVSYHIASVFLEELRPFLPLRPELLEIVFKPFIFVMGSLPDKVLLGKIKRNMFDVLLKMGNRLLEVKKLGDDNEVHDDDDAVVLGTIALTIGFSSKFFELASSDKCCQGNMNRNRKVLFVLAEQFLKLEKDLESSGIQVWIPRGIDVDDDKRVPTLIPIGTDMEVGGLGKPLKMGDKKKKKRKASCGSGAADEDENVAAVAGLDNDAVKDVAITKYIDSLYYNNDVDKMTGTKCIDAVFYCSDKVYSRNRRKMIGTKYIDGFYCSDKVCSRNSHKMIGTKYIDGFYFYNDVDKMTGTKYSNGFYGSDKVYSRKMIGTKYIDGFYCYNDVDKMTGAKYSNGFYCSDDLYSPNKSAAKIFDNVYRPPSNKSGAVYFFDDPFRPPLMPDKVRRTMEETVVGLKIILSNGKHRKETIVSGAVISEDGVVLTCAHLLRDYEKPEYYLWVAEVVFFNGQTYEAKVITEDMGKDLALLKIYADHQNGELKFSHAPLAMPQTIETPMSAYLISNPYYFSVSFTAAIVRYRKRLNGDLEFENVMKLDHDTAIIQTNIVCETGNFGGPLFSDNGEIMGVKFASTETFKFGIHVESILIFLEKNKVVMKKNIR